MSCDSKTASVAAYAATREIIAEIDVKSEKLKKRILTAASKYKVKGKT